MTVTVFGTYAHDALPEIYEHFDLYLDDDEHGIAHCMNEFNPFYNKPTREDAKRVLQEFLP
jgi:hypothetical protein